MNAKPIRLAGSTDNDLFRVKYTAPGAEIKPPAYPGDAGFDVITVEQVPVYPHSVAKVDIGMAVALPPGRVCTFITRSSALVYGLFVVPTLIDNGYRGPLFLFVMNVTDMHLMVPAGVSIAQMVLLANEADTLSLIQVDELPPSDRGTNGFGSSGRKVT